MLCIDLHIKLGHNSNECISAIDLTPSQKNFWQSPLKMPFESLSHDVLYLLLDITAEDSLCAEDGPIFPDTLLSLAAVNSALRAVYKAHESNLLRKALLCLAGNDKNYKETLILSKKTLTESPKSFIINHDKNLENEDEEEEEVPEPNIQVDELKLVRRALSIHRLLLTYARATYRLTTDYDETPSEKVPFEYWIYIIYSAYNYGLPSRIKGMPPKYRNKVVARIVALSPEDRREREMLFVLKQVKGGDSDYDKEKRIHRMKVLGDGPLGMQLRLRYTHRVWHQGRQWEPSSTPQDPATVDWDAIY